MEGVYLRARRPWCPATASRERERETSKKTNEKDGSYVTQKGAIDGEREREKFVHVVYI